MESSTWVLLLALVLSWQILSSLWAKVRHPLIVPRSLGSKILGFYGLTQHREMGLGQREVKREFPEPWESGGECGEGLWGLCLVLPLPPTVSLGKDQSGFLLTGP